MNFLKRFWRWLMAEKQEEQYLQVKNFWVRNTLGEVVITRTEVYDPNTDETKILRGEVESYFE